MYLKLKNKLIIILCCFTLWNCKSPEFDGEKLLVLKGCTIIDVDAASIIKDKDIIIENGLIRSITNTQEYTFPKNTEIIDTKGKFVLPGFVEMHAHLPSDTSIQAEVLRTYLSFGVTTILNPMADSLSGFGLREKVASGIMHGPKIYFAGKGINGPSWLDNFGSWVPVVNEGEVKAEVNKQANQGVDFIKVYAHLPPDLLKVAVNESHSRNLKVIGHLGKTSWREAAEAGIDIIVHSGLSGPTWELIPGDSQNVFKSNYFPSVNWPHDYDPSLFSIWLKFIDYQRNETRDLISALLNNHVTVDPNLVVFESIVWGNEKETKIRLGTNYAPEKTRVHWSADLNPGLTSWSEEDFSAVQSAWPKFMEFVRMLHENGVTLTAGSDYSNPWIAPGASYHRELELLVEAGISCPDVLRIATRNGASVLGVLDKIGTIEQGKTADLVILEANPFDNISNTKKIYSVILEGKVVGRDDL